MSDKLITHVVGIAIALTGVAIVAVVLSNKGNTPDVLKAASGSFGGALRCALSPITGSDCGTQTSSSISFG